VSFPAGFTLVEQVSYLGLGGLATLTSVITAANFPSSANHVLPCALGAVKDPGICFTKRNNICECTECMQINICKHREHVEMEQNTEPKY